jgi:ubiquinone biosynthesis protein
MRILMSPGSSLKSLRRFQHVVNVLIKYGFGQMLSRIRIWECVHIERRFLRRECEIPGLVTAQRIRLAIEELGPTFIKLGQVLSTRPDLIPEDIIYELKKLQSSAHFISAEAVRNVVESELARPISEIFDSFDDTPLAAASLAQVHRAVLHGEQVVLKVQRPNIAEIIEEDIGIMRTLAGLAERYSHTIYLINPLGLVNEVAGQIKKELDFRMEASNTRRFKQNFAGDDSIHIPTIYPELSSKRVITMEYLDGINITETNRLRKEGYNLTLIARRGALLGYKSTFQYGFFHADPHPGNIFVLPGNVIGLVDFGMMADLSVRDRERLAKLVYFIAIRDDKRVARALNDLMESEDVIPAEELEPSMAGIIREYGDVPTAELSLGAMLFVMMRAIMNHGGRLRPQLMWLTKSIASQEEMAHSLKADFNMMELAKPFAQKVMTEKLNPFRRPDEILYWFNEGIELLKDLPYDIGIILREFRKGKLKIEFEHVGLEPMRQTISRAANRLSLTVLIASLLIASSVVVLAQVPPFVGSIPVIGFFGYLLAIVLSFILAFSVLFHSR